MIRASGPYHYLRGIDLGGMDIYGIDLERIYRGGIGLRMISDRIKVLL